MEEKELKEKVDKLKGLIKKYKDIAKDPFSVERNDYIAEAESIGLTADVSEDLLKLDEADVNLEFLESNFPWVTQRLLKKRYTFMESLSEILKTHPSVNHPLYERLINGKKLDRGGLLRFCAGYHDMAQGYLEVAATAILHQGMKDQRVMIEMTKTLHSELGFGDPRQVHHEYFLLFPESQGIPREEILNASPVPASERYNQGLIKIYAGDLPEFLGAQTAFEMDAKEMIHKVHEAARRYTIDPKDLSYFHLHLWFEDVHVDWAEKSMGPYINNGDSRSKIQSGFNRELELKKEWLDGLYGHVFKESL